MAFSTNASRRGEMVASPTPSCFATQRLELGPDSRTLWQEWPYIRRIVESILNKNLDTSLHSAIYLVGPGNFQVQAGGPKIAFVSMRRKSNASAWAEVGDEIQEFLDTTSYGLQLRMEYDGELGIAVFPAVQTQSIRGRRQLRRKESQRCIGSGRRIGLACSHGTWQQLISDFL